MNNLDLMAARLSYRGGTAQQDRMIKDKREALDRVVLYSYQGARIKKIDSEEIAPALINPNRVSQDYDDKIVSVGFEYGIAAGDIFTWVNTDSQWLIYSQELTEVAYFRGKIRRCRYQIEWLADGAIKSTWAAVTGPSQTNIDSQKWSGGILDNPNYSLRIMVPQNEDTIKFFKRYAEFYLKDNDTCWRIEAVDTISCPGIIEVNATEYYANEHEDGEGVVGSLIPAPTTPEPSSAQIEGEVFIKPRTSYTYKYVGDEKASWEYDSKLPIEVDINDKFITLSWNKMYSGQFVLKYGSNEKTIVVESLF